MRIWMKHLWLGGIALLYLMGCTLPLSSGPDVTTPDRETALVDCRNALERAALQVAANKIAVTSGAPVDFTICSHHIGFITMWSTVKGGRVWPIYTTQVPGKAKPHVVRDYEVHGTPGWKYIYVVWTRTPEDQPRDSPTCRSTTSTNTPHSGIPQLTKPDCLVTQLAIEIIR